MVTEQSNQGIRRVYELGRENNTARNTENPALDRMISNTNLLFYFIVPNEEQDELVSRWKMQLTKSLPPPLPYLVYNNCCCSWCRLGNSGCRRPLLSSLISSSSHPELTSSTTSLYTEIHRLRRLTIWGISLSPVLSNAYTLDIGRRKYLLPPSLPLPHVTESCNIHSRKLENEQAA